MNPAPTSLFLCVSLSLTAFSRGAVLFDFNSGNGGFTTAATPGMAGPFVYTANGGTGASGGWTANGQAPDLGTNATTTITSPALTVQAAGQVVLSFDHMFSFEGGNWDGGAVMVSVNGGAFNYVSSAAFTANGYTGVVANWGPGPGQSDLADLLAWVQDSPGRGSASFITSTANLGPFAAGDSIQVQFMSASDANTSGAFTPQWSIDNVSLSNIVPEPGTALLSGGVVLLAGFRRRRA